MEARTCYFLCNARVRCSFAAVVRSVSGTFLFIVSFLRSTALIIGNGGGARADTLGVVFEHPHAAARNHRDAGRGGDGGERIGQRDES